MKISKVTTTQSLLTVILGVLPSLASSIYIDPIKNTKTYPQVKVVIETIQQLRGEAPREATVQQDIIVELKTYNEVKGLFYIQEDVDPMIRGHLTGTWGGTGLPEDEPRLFVSLTGETPLDSPKTVQRVVEVIPPEGVHNLLCWLIEESGVKTGFATTPTDEIITKVQCAALYFNLDYVQEYREWVGTEDGVEGLEAE